MNDSSHSREPARWRAALSGVLCLAALALAVDPSGELPLASASIQHNQGLAFTAPVDGDIASDRDGTSALLLFEDGRELGAGHAAHDDIRSLGGGRYSHWGDTLYFSSSDGSDPRTNGRSYRTSLPTRFGSRWPWRLLTCVGLLVLALVCAGRRAGSEPERADAPAPERRDAGVRRGLAALALAAGVALYLYAALMQARSVNTDVMGGDQSAYLSYAEQWVLNGSAFVAERNRMPALPWLLRSVYTRGLDRQQFFVRAQYLHIGLSLVLLVLVGCLARRLLAASSALCLTAVAAFTLFQFKAGWVQAELLYYTLALLTFVLAAACVARPSLRLGLAAGAAAAVAQLSKAAALPVVLLVMLSCGVRWLVALRRGAAGAPGRRGPLLAALGLAASFLLILWPYISESRQHYGQYFYNVNSTFYMWYDSWAECTEGTGAHRDLYGWPDMPEEELPGPARWLAENGVTGALARLGEGLDAVRASVLRSDYGYLDYAMLYPLFALALLLARPRQALAALREYAWPVAFALCWLLAYTLLAAWYARIIPQPRFVLALYLPLLLSAAVVMRHAEAWYARLGWGRWKLTAAQAFSLLVVVLLIADIHTGLVDRIFRVDGGS